LNPSYPSFPTLFSWYIWNEINLTIFDAGSPSCQKVSFKSIGEDSIYGINANVNPPRNAQVNILTRKAIAWFDGASQQRGEKSEAGGKIMINSNTSYL
jgi:hypothetical protein